MFALPDNNFSNGVVDSLGAVAMDADLLGGTASRYFKREEMDKLPNDSVRKPATFDDFSCHDLTIRKVKHLYSSQTFNYIR